MRKLQSPFYQYILLSLILITLSTSTAHAQVLAKGSIRDAQGPLELATVLLVNPQDSTIAAHSVANREGTYELHAKKGKALSGEFWLQVHILGYKTQSRTVKLPLATAQDFVMEEDPTEIEAVRVKARRKGVKIQGDTVKYNIRAYTTGAEKTLGDLLDQLPGIKVSGDGTVTAQGKEVKKILFNGRDLFGDNVRLATQNINADMADSVKVVHGYSEYSVLDGFQNKDETVIDVSVKKSMWNRLTGELEAGGGYKCLYSTRNKLMYLGTNSMFSAIVNANNTSEPSFSFMDYIAYQGGATRHGNSYSFSFNSNEGLSRILMPAEDTYRKHDGVAALNYTYHKEKKIKIITGLLLSFGNADSENRSTLTWNAGPEKGQRYHSAEERHTKTKGIYSTVKLDYSPTDKMGYHYRMTGFIADDRSDRKENYLYRSQPFENQITKQLTSWNLSQVLEGEWKLGEHGIEAYLSHSYWDKSPEESIRSNQLVLPLVIAPLDGEYPLDYSVVNRKHSASVEVKSKLRLGETQFIEVYTGGDLRHETIGQLFEAPTGDVRPQAEYGAALGNDARVVTDEEKLGVRWRKNQGLVQWSLGVQGTRWGSHLKDLAQDTRTEYSQFYALPTASLKLKFSPMHSLRFRVDTNTEKPEGRDLLPGYRMQSLTSLYYNRAIKGYVNLAPEASVSYSIYNDEQNINMNLNGSYSYLTEQVDDTEQRGLLRIYKPWGDVHGHEIYASGWAYLKLGVYWNWGINPYYRYVQDQTVLANQRLDEYRQRVRLSSHFNSTYHFPLNVSFGGSIGKSWHRLQDDAYRSYLSWSSYARLKFKKGAWRASAKVAYTHSPFPFDNAANWNIEGDCSWDINAHFTIGLTGYNLMTLGRYEVADTSFSPLTTTEQVYRTMPGHVILSLKYTLGSHKSKGRSMTIISQ